MATVIRFNVERCSRNGTALYLDRTCNWSTDPDEAWEYSDADEAEADAGEHGGEVFQFERLMRRTDAESFTNVHPVFRPILSAIISPMEAAE